MSNTPVAQADKMRRYYKFHAAIYDWTRWTFLLGRIGVLKQLPTNIKSLFEVGCGTGHNLKWLSRRHNTMHLCGVDVSADMLDKARTTLNSAKDRVTLIHDSYQKTGFRPETPPDAILFSYSLTMFNPGWEAAILCAKEDLPTDGRIVVVDFHNSPHHWFKRWMGFNHVRMDGHLLPFLQKHFATEHVKVRSAYFGLWYYVAFIGTK